MLFQTRTTASKTLDIDAGQGKGHNQSVLIGQAAGKSAFGDKQGGEVFATSGGEAEQEESSRQIDVVKQAKVVGAVEQEQSVANDAGREEGLKQVVASGDEDVDQ